MITHRGKPQAVLLPIEDLQSWEETLDITSNKKLMGEIRQAEKDYQKGRFIPLKSVEKSLTYK